MRLPKFMDLKFHKKNGSINWLAFYWIWWGVYLVPVSVIGLFVSGPLDDIFDTAWMFGFIPMVAFMFLDLSQFRKQSKLWDRLFEEQVKLMSVPNWSADPKKVKQLEKLRKEMDHWL